MRTGRNLPGARPRRRRRSARRSRGAHRRASVARGDSKLSFAIEGEHPPQDRVQRWGQVIGEAGRRPIDLDELLRLQRIVIGDARFVHLGLRVEGGFVGFYYRTSGAPLPDHISARPLYPRLLIDGLGGARSRLRCPTSIRRSPPPRSPSALSTHIRSRTGIAGRTPISSITFLPSAGSTRSAACVSGVGGHPRPYRDHLTARRARKLLGAPCCP